MENLPNAAGVDMGDAASAEPGLSVLVVGGDTRRPETVPAETEDGSERPVHYARLADLDAQLLARIEPGLVVSPLFDGTVDCVDVAYRLSMLGFMGQYRAVAERLPHPAIVRREVKSLCPRLDFDIIETGGGAPRH